MTSKTSRVVKCVLSSVALLLLSLNSCAFAQEQAPPSDPAWEVEKFVRKFFEAGSEDRKTMLAPDAKCDFNPPDKNLAWERGSQIVMVPEVKPIQSDGGGGGTAWFCLAVVDQYNEGNWKLYEVKVEINGDSLKVTSCGNNPICHDAYFSLDSDAKEKIAKSVSRIMNSSPFERTKWLSPTLADVLGQKTYIGAGLGHLLPVGVGESGVIKWAGLTLAYQEQKDDFGVTLKDAWKKCDDNPLPERFVVILQEDNGEAKIIGLRKDRFHDELVAKRSKIKAVVEKYILATPEERRKMEVSKDIFYPLPETVPYDFEWPKYLADAIEPDPNSPGVWNCTVRLGCDDPEARKKIGHGWVFRVVEEHGEFRMKGGCPPPGR